MNDIRILEDEYSQLDGRLDHLLFLSNAGLEVDMCEWYSIIGKMETIQKRLSTLKYGNVDVMNEAIARADALLDELHDMLNVDPFGPGDCLPDVEPEYDEYQEWQDMTSQLRRGDA